MQIFYGVIGTVLSLALLVFASCKSYLYGNKQGHKEGYEEGYNVGLIQPKQVQTVQEKEESETKKKRERLEEHFNRLFTYNPRRKG